MPDSTAIRAAIEAVQDLELRRSLGELGMVREVAVGADGAVTAEVALPAPSYPREDLAAAITAAAAGVAGVSGTTVEFGVMSDAELANVVAAVKGGAAEGVVVGGPGSPTRVVTISSGKGGVGKSSITANMAVALASGGHSVGVIDADVWGFSIPKMLGMDRPPTVVADMLLPPQAYGVRVISMDYFVEPDQAVIWRGPMLHKALEQFLADVHWDDPEFLLIDMPPGTGDVAISISQFVPRAQSIVVTTPQITAQRVAKRAALMARKVNQEVIGVVENMSWFTGDDGVRYPIFGEGGGAALAAELEVPLLAQIPLVPALRASADAGRPALDSLADSEAALAFTDLAERVTQAKPSIRAHPDLVIR